MDELLRIHMLTVELPTTAGWVRPVNEVTLCIAPGEALGLVGESGSGKTMLSLAMMGLLPPGARVSGEAFLNTADGQPKNLTNLNEPEWREVRGRVIAALEQAAMPEPEVRAKQFPHQLSGGLRQRAMIAMALAARPKLLIADEPTTALDVTVQKQILELLDRLRREMDLGLLFITHDLGVVAQVAERVAVMYAGRVVEEGPASDVLMRPLHPYTQGLLAASPTLVRGKLTPIPGTVPQLTELSPGCAFVPRCTYRRAECERGVPEFRPAQSGHAARCVLL